MRARFPRRAQRSNTTIGATTHNLPMSMKRHVGQHTRRQFFSGVVGRPRYSGATTSIVLAQYIIFTLFAIV